MMTILTIALATMHIHFAGGGGKKPIPVIVFKGH